MQSRRAFLTGAMSAASVAASMPWLAVPAVDSRPPAGHLSELCRATVAQLAQLIRRREASSLEVVNAHLARIEQVNP